VLLRMVSQLWQDGKTLLHNTLCKIL